MTPDQIRAARHKLALTQAQLAPLLGYAAHVRIAELENGKRNPSEAVVRLLTAYLSGYRPADWPK